MVAGNGRIIINDSYDIIDGAMYHIFSSTSSGIATTTKGGKYVNILNNPLFSKAFACAQTNSVINWRMPFKGNARGRKHIISDAGCIALKSIGSDPKKTPNQFPGNIAGDNVSGWFNGEIYSINKGFIKIVKSTLIKLIKKILSRISKVRL